MIELAEIKFKYSYQCRDFIEKSNYKKFKLLSKKDSDKVLLEYNNILFEVNAQIDNKNIFIDSYINRNEKEKYKEEFNIESEYLVDELYKEYIGLKYKNINYVKRNTLRVNNKNKKNYINPKVEIKGSVANIIDNDEIVAKVNDVRSISILKTINRNKDFIVINNNELEILTLKFIDRNDDEFEIIIYGDEKNYNKIKKMIDKGCRINEEFWLFSVDDEINQAEDTLLIKLPDDCWAKGSLQGNKLIIKEIMRKPRTKIRGIASAIVRPAINTTFKRQEEISSYIEKDDFNQRKYEEEKNTEFIKVINEYKKIEFEVLEENKNKCKDLRYISLENNKFIIHSEDLEKLVNWSGREGTNISYLSRGKSFSIGNIKEVGDDFIQVDFSGDIEKSAISRKKGKISISFFGDEIVQRRRANAIKLLENNSAALANLATILSSEEELNEFRNKIVIEKYERDNLIEKQIAAVEGALNTPDIFLIQGPPGTGKTTVIRKIVQKILEEKKNPLITSYQNLAVDNVLEGFLSKEIIPHRFGNENNDIMSKISSEIMSEINLTLKQNISLENEEVLNEIKENLDRLRCRIFACDKREDVITSINEILNEIERYEGKSSNYIRINNILEEILDRQKDNKILFNAEEFKEMMPKEFNYDLSVIEALEKSEKYLTEVNKDLASKTITNIINKLKEMQELDVIFTLDNSEYQRIKNSIFDDLKLIKVNNAHEENDLFEFVLEVAAIVDEIYENMPEYIEDEKYSVVKNFHKKISNNPLLIERILEKYPDIRGTTCQKTGSGKFNQISNNVNYDFVIIDEAAKANPLDLLIPLVKGQRIILVGDHKQLPHLLEEYVENKFKDDKDFDIELFNKYIKESLFGRLFNELPTSRKVMLDTQYRMTKEIGDLVSELFYEGKLKTGSKIVNDTPLYTGHALVKVDIRANQTKTSAGSYINVRECEEIIKKLIELDSRCNGKKYTVGVISFYKAQVNYIQKQVKTLNLKNIDISVGTVDGYQGLEKDIIFISTVRTKGIGFTANPNRLNVALSRAKKIVVIFGDMRNLKENDLFNKIITKCIDGEVE